MPQPKELSTTHLRCEMSRTSPGAVRRSVSPLAWSSSSPLLLLVSLGLMGAVGCGGDGAGDGTGDGTDDGTDDGTGGAPGVGFDVASLVGVWTGRTAEQDRPVVLEIDDAGSVSGFQVEMAFAFGPDTCTAPFVATAARTVTEDDFELPLAYPLSDLSAVATLHFDGDTIAGRIPSMSGVAGVCGDSAVVGTDGSLSVSSKTFELTRCSGGCSVPACQASLRGDGQCDGPGRGTSLCFASTDPDCESGAPSEPVSSDLRPNEELEGEVATALEARLAEIGCDQGWLQTAQTTAVAQQVADDFDRGVTPESDLAAEAGITSGVSWLGGTLTEGSAAVERVSAFEDDTLLPCEPLSVGISVAGTPGARRGYAIVVAHCLECGEECSPTCDL